MEAAIAWDKQHQISHEDNFVSNLVTLIDSISINFSHWVSGFRVGWFKVSALVINVLIAPYDATFSNNLASAVCACM